MSFPRSDGILSAMKPVLCYITTSTKDEARVIGLALVEKRLAGCVNILEGMESIFHWEGKLETAHECVLIAKTDAKLVEPLIATVKALHSYSIPCVLTLPVDKGNPDYLNWLAGNLR